MTMLSVPSANVKVKLVDFGNAISSADVSLYLSDFKLQTLAYRAPEVLLGLPFDFAVDMWYETLTIVTDAALTLSRETFDFQVLISSCRIG